MSWNSMTDQEKTEALARLLGWHKVEHPAPYGCTETWWEDRCRVNNFAPMTDGNSMSLVVDAMLGRGYSLTLLSPGAVLNDEAGTFAKKWMAFFDDWRLNLPGVDALPPEEYGKLWLEVVANGHGEGDGDSAPAAVVLAALKALGGE